MKRFYYMVTPSNRPRRMREAAEGLWQALFHVNEGDWAKQSEEWQKEAEAARDKYFEVLSEGF